MTSRKANWIWLGFFLIAWQAGAQLIRVEVTGHVQGYPTGWYDDAPGEFPSILPGAVMTGYALYSTESPDQDPSTYHGKYQLEDISMQIGPYRFGTSPYLTGEPIFEVWKGDETYLASCPAQMGIYLNGIRVASGGQFTLLDLCNASSGRTDDAFPTSFPEDISFFYYRNRFSAAGNFINLSGVIDSINAVVIPEPVTMLLVGLGGLLMRRRQP